MLEHSLVHLLSIVSDCFHDITAKLNSCNRNHITYKTSNIYYLTLQRRSLLILALSNCVSFGHQIIKIWGIQELWDNTGYINRKEWQNLVNKFLPHSIARYSGKFCNNQKKKKSILDSYKTETAQSEAHNFIQDCWTYDLWILVS